MNSSHYDKALHSEKLAEFVLFTQRTCILGLADYLVQQKISFSQLFLLIYLTHEESITMSDIAKKMGHSTAAATGLVDRMEKLHLMRREYVLEDRRKIRVYITAEGYQLVAKINQRIIIALNKERATLEEEGLFPYSKSEDFLDYSEDTLKEKNNDTR